MLTRESNKIVFYMRLVDFMFHPRFLVSAGFPFSIYNFSGNVMDYRERSSLEHSIHEDDEHWKKEHPEAIYRRH